MQGADPLAPDALLAGRYRIGSLLGVGGMSFVHRAVDETLGREVAVKALVGAPTDSAEFERVRAEIDVLAAMNHRALVTLFDAGTDEVDGRAVTYLVMELVDGPTLSTRAAAAAIAPQEIARMARDLAEALMVVHARGVVHRDIKPANVLLAPTPLPAQEFTAKLADFGIAAIVDGERLTATGTVLGTAAYLSPEQAAGHRVGPASDIYSLGLVLLETITGRREYPGPLMESLSARQSRDPVIPGAIGYRWKSLLAAMTARDAEARPSAGEVLERLSDATGGLALPVLSAEIAATAAATAPVGFGGRAADDAVGPQDDAIGPAATAAAAVPAATLAVAHGAAHVAPAADAREGSTTAVLSSAANGDSARRRRRFGLVGAVAAGFAALAIVLGFAVQGALTTEPTEPPAVADTPSPTVAPDPAETTAAPTAPAPAPAEGVPAGNDGVGATDGGSGDDGNGNSGNNGNGNGNSGNNGNGNNGNGNGNSGNNGNNNGNGNGNSGNNGNG